MLLEILRYLFNLYMTMIHVLKHRVAVDDVVLANMTDFRRLIADATKDESCLRRECQDVMRVIPYVVEIILGHQRCGHLVHVLEKVR